MCEGGSKGSDVFFPAKKLQDARWEVVIRQPIMMHPPRCMPLRHNNQQVGGQGRAGTARGRQGDVSYDVFCFGKNAKMQRGGG